MSDFKGRRLEIDALRALWAIRHHGGITRAAEAQPERLCYALVWKKKSIKENTT